MDAEVIIVLPERSEDCISGGLRMLTRRLCDLTGESGIGGLGGRYGYGIEYENDVFMMHPYCWCDKDGCPWCDWEYDEPQPNFLYKPTGAKVEWYKWIGRSMDVYGELPADWLQQCMSSAGEGRGEELI